LILKRGKSVDYLYFILKGNVHLSKIYKKNEENKVNVERFLTLPKFSWFGDYQILSHMNSNFNFIAGHKGVTLL